MPTASTAERVTAHLRRLSNRLAGFPSPRTQRLLLLGALPLLVVGAVLSYRHADLAVGDLRVLPLFLAATLGLPPVVAVNAWEYRLTGRAVGQRIGGRASFEIAILSTVLNYLPGHGGALLRIQTLRRDGSAYRRAGGATIAAGLLWLGVAGTIPGVWLLVDGSVGVGAVLALGGLGALSVGALALASAAQRDGHWVRLLMVLTFAEVLSVLSLAFRYYLILLAVGYDTRPAVAATVLALAAVLAAATGVMPGGLGVRELVASVLGPLAGLPVSLAFLVTAIDRVLGLTGHALAAIPLLRRRGADGTETLQHDGDPEEDQR
jgi:hypothetical protein